jgi:predicted regulator of Ras-like GTPase activity (Roadblock/LC7/MglB family)
MSDLTTLAKLPDVKSAVLGDLAGALLDAVREPDPETVAAVVGFVSSALAQAGDQLGLGALRRIAIGAGARACLVVVQGHSVVAAWVEPARSLPAVEKVLDAAAEGRV